MNLEVTRAPREESPVLEQLLELYAYELSDIADLAIGPDGRFGCGALPRYWTEPDRVPYLVRIDRELAGFVLVQQGSLVTGDPEVWDVAEFFVLKRHRQRGIGVRVAHEVWRRHCGAWEVRVMQRNTSALAFWRRAVEAFEGSPAESELVRAGEKVWHLFRVSSAQLPN